MRPRQADAAADRSAPRRSTASEDCPDNALEAAAVQHAVDCEKRASDIGVAEVVG